MCLHGSGPFLFLLDTGSSLSNISAKLLAQFDVPPVPGVHRFSTPACITDFDEASLNRWSIAGRPIPPTTVVQLSYLSNVLALDGIIGSDVLSLFGAVRIDFHNATLTFGTSRIPAFTGMVTTYRDAITRLLGSYRTLATGRVVLDDPHATFFGHETEVSLTLRGAREPDSFIVDTGSDQTSLRGSGISLPVVRPTIDVIDPRCATPVPVGMVATGPWSLDGLALAPTTIQAIRVPESNPLATVAETNPSRLGLLGTDVLSRYRAVVLGFYANRVVFLGP